MSDLMAGNKKVIGWALGDHEFLDGNGVENLNAFYIDRGTNNDWNHQSFTIDMTKYFNEADAKHSDVQYYQIILRLFFNFSDGTMVDKQLLSPLLKRGEINNKRSLANDGGAIATWFTDPNKLAVRTKCTYDTFTYGSLAFNVYGFTAQDVGTGLIDGSTQ